MSEIAEIIDSVESRIAKLFTKINSLENSSILLKEELYKAATVIQKQSDEIAALKSECESLKMANSLLGGEENKRDTKLKIKLSIADRVYPLTVDMSQEEGLRSASKKIDAMIKQFEENYAVRDKQDVLAMCALQFASQVEQKKVDSSIDSKDLERLKKINDLVADYLEKK